MAARRSTRTRGGGTDSRTSAPRAAGSRARAGSARRSSRTQGSGRTQRSGRTQNDNSRSLTIGAGIAAVVLVVAIFVIAGDGGGDDAAAAGRDGAAHPGNTAGESASAQPSTPALGGSSGREGAPPDRPAPSIDQADVALAEEHHQRARELWNEAQRARSVGDTGTYTAKVQEAWAEINACRDALREYTDWFSEADLEEWAIPGEYVALMRRVGKQDVMYGKIRKIRQVR